MPRKRFDPTLKKLIEDHPRDWARFLCGLAGLPSPRTVDAIDSDVSTVSAVSDKVLRVGTTRPWLLHVEFVVGHNARLDRLTLLYNVLLAARHELPVHSIVVLLRKEADRSSITGTYRRQGADGQIDLEFHYTVVRVWELSANVLLTGGVGVLPLAPLARVTQEAAPDIVRRMEERFEEELSREDVKEFWAATNILLGLRYSPTFIEGLLRRVRGMKESVTYQAILAEGARKLLVRYGRRHLGDPDANTQAALDAITDVSRLEGMADHLDDVSSWDELLKVKGTRKSKGDRKKP